MLRSPNIAVTYDIGEEAGTDFIVMEYVDGELLSARIARGPIPLREVIEIGIQVADALDEAHSRGIVHRDIKSANLMFTERGLVEVLDFGLAKFIGGGSAGDVTQAQMTMAGIVVGTVSYMAPEQALGRPVDHRVDLFSLGVVLFELLTGRMPFDGTTPTEIIDHILHEVPPPPSQVHDRNSACAGCGRRPCARKGSGVPLPERVRDGSRPASDRARHRQRLLGLRSVVAAGRPHQQRQALSKNRWP